MSAAKPTKISWKLQEFVAHGSDVSCLALGRNSGRVMTTGGEDHKVNLWAVGKPNCIMSLSGHTSPVECVRFKDTEELVLAGSRSGALKIWDLEAAKIVRTLTGHKSSVRSLDFHPYGEYVASGSLDTNVKLWDIRRKGCIFTYKGHTDCVNCLRFSPDGRWIASAGEDGTAKLWDLTAGKLLYEFTDHMAAVSSLEFHPNEFLLVTGSADRTVRFWDLEKFQLVSASEGEACGVRCVLFNPDGSCLFSGSQDMMRVMGWEPFRCFDSLHVGWGKLADLSILSNQLIGASFQKSTVSVYIVDLAQVNKSGLGLLAADRPAAPLSPNTTPSRANYVRPHTSSSKQANEMKREPEQEARGANGDEEEEESSSAEITNPDEYKKIFQPSPMLDRTPPKKAEPFPAPPEEDGLLGKNVLAVVHNDRPLTKAKRQVPSVVVSEDPATNQTEAAVVPGGRKAPLGLRAADFLPNPEREMTEEEVLSQVRKGYETLCTLLTDRHKKLKIVLALWTSCEIKTAIDAAISMNDAAVINDVLGIMNSKPSLWRLDLCPALIPQIEKLLHSKYESYVLTGCVALKIILQNFASVIKGNLTVPPSSVVDITREERYQKCKVCHRLLMNLRPLLDSRKTRSGRVSGAFRELGMLMITFD
ncbi:katanin p80 WD40 repeat-containing subunit B1 [Lethenteron reissneri]|uniref:katanin p80 WD40 repeat-containing subunit B1 n=1 Tax=Lethenteron reissneri TaxID=7753 RepID=UPI002AB7740A|nr:katanin p80 WD40 repeat-containing subunit B1 [Lethenteron reissneri]